MSADLGPRMSSNSLHVDVELDLLHSMFDRSETMCYRVLLVRTVPLNSTYICDLPPDHEGPHSASGYASWVSL